MLSGSQHARASKTTVLKLPDVCVSGLSSVVQRSGLQIHVLAYQEFSNVPEGVVVLDACEFLSKAVREDQLSIIRVAEMADLVRYLAIQKRGGGWILDCETVWRSRAPPLDMATPPGFGHFFSSVSTSVRTPWGQWGLARGNSMKSYGGGSCTIFESPRIRHV